MASRWTLLVGVVLVVATAVLILPAAAAPATDGGAGIVDAATADNETAGNETAAFGTQMGAFMQSNAAHADEAVDNGMWEAAFERANESERARLAAARANGLETELETLRERNATLYRQYQNGTISQEEYLLEASRLQGQAEGFEHGVTGTARAAERAGLNVSALDRLRTDARNMTGPEVAGVARGLVRGDRGPPADVPGQGPPTDRPGGPPTDRGPTGETPMNTTATDRPGGPPTDRGPPGETSTDTTPTNDTAAEGTPAGATPTASPTPRDGDGGNANGGDDDGGRGPVDTPPDGGRGPPGLIGTLLFP